MNIAKQGGCTWEDVSKFEQAYGIKFPPDYAEFLAKYNGGETPKTEFYFSRRLESDVRFFFGIGDVKHSVQKSVFPEEIELPNLLERGLFPIAENAYGDYILIDIANTPGRIYFCIHDEGFEILKLTDNFAAFVQRCKSRKVNFEHATRSIAEREADLISRGKGANITEGLKRIWQEEIDRYTGMVLEKVKLS